MKKVGFLCLALLIILAISHDLLTTHENKTIKNKQVRVIPFRTAEIKPKEDDTVFSIIESLHHNQPIPKSTTEMMQDFKALNPEINPYQLNLHKTYFFPLYEK